MRTSHVHITFLFSYFQQQNNTTKEKNVKQKTKGKNILKITRTHFLWAAAVVAEYVLLLCVCMVWLIFHFAALALTIPVFYLRSLKRNIENFVCSLFACFSFFSFFLDVCLEFGSFFSALSIFRPFLFSPPPFHYFFFNSFFPFKFLFVSYKFSSFLLGSECVSAPFSCHSAVK